MNPSNRLHVATIYASRDDGDVENNVILEGNASEVASALRTLRDRNPVAFEQAVVMVYPYAPGATMEQQEAGLSEADPEGPIPAGDFLRDSGGMTLIEEAFEVSQNMQKYGGHFVGHLGAALQRADLNNVRKIRDTWPDEWIKYLRWNRTRQEEKS